MTHIRANIKPICYVCMGACVLVRVGMGVGVGVIISPHIVFSFPSPVECHR